MAHTQPVVLVILDGFGHCTHREYNAIAHADTPNLTRWLQAYPHTFLHASGRAVGLPDAYVGNSEVGHLTIGAGRILAQPVSIINDAITRKTLCINTVLIHSLQTVARKRSKLHIMGLVSDAGVHGLLTQLCAYIEIAIQQSIEQIIVHAFLDGRDCAPQAGGQYLRILQDMIDRYPVISSLIL